MWKKKKLSRKWLKVRKTRSYAHGCLRKWVKISFATPTFMFIEQHTHTDHQSQTLYSLLSSSFILSHIFLKFHRFFFFTWPSACECDVCGRCEGFRALLYTSSSVFEWGLAYWHKILQMGVCVGGPRNLPKSRRCIHAIFGASEYCCQSSQVSSTACTFSGPWIKSLSKIISCLTYPAWPSGRLACAASALLRCAKSVCSQESVINWLWDTFQGLP